MTIYISGMDTSFTKPLLNTSDSSVTVIMDESLVRGGGYIYYLQEIDVHDIEHLIWTGGKDKTAAIAFGIIGGISWGALAAVGGELGGASNGGTVVIGAIIGGGLTAAVASALTKPETIEVNLQGDIEKWKQHRSSIPPFTRKTNDLAENLMNHDN